ncbi:MAG TPA: glucose 1-dehydrogenase [Rhodopila sp.]|jgi:NAD(P)-dependent dehydrogenase (short-subunit alcohol dehydrogenase family)|nr:glucose 1-dehydrogenase [Rhodopila sp.]
MVSGHEFAGKVSYDFSGRTVAIFGGTTGIGRSVARDFAKAGANVVVSGLGAADGQSLAEEIKVAGNANVVFLEADVTRDADIKKVMDTAVTHFGRVHCAFNNAGIPGPNKPVHEMTDAEYQLLMDVNLKGVFLGMRAQIPHMLEHGGGAIVNTASLFSDLAFPGTAVYCATKSGVANLTRSAAFEVARRGIRINALAPGPVMTNLLHGMFGGEDEAKRIVTRFVPAKRLSHPDEHARVVLFLCSDAASFMHGHLLRVDGGGFEASAIDMDMPGE